MPKNNFKECPRFLEISGNPIDPIHFQKCSLTLDILQYGKVLIFWSFVNKFFSQMKRCVFTLSNFWKFPEI